MARKRWQVVQVVNRKRARHVDNWAVVWLAAAHLTHPCAHAPSASSRVARRLCGCGGFIIEEINVCETNALKGGASVRARAIRWCKRASARVMNLEERSTDFVQVRGQSAAKQSENRGKRSNEKKIKTARNIRLGRCSASQRRGTADRGHSNTPVISYALPVKCHMAKVLRLR